MVDEYGERADTWPADSDLYPVWLAMSPEPLRVYVSRAALAHLAGLVDEPGAIDAWLDAHGLAGAVERRREVLVTAGGVRTDLDAE
ncbi:MAG: hypothetical protein U5K43_06685 [Halofilum sp. (in: g-proteobacteria)]|nr:hypothetical protein [Halofilum sp. (in: g-proteobacteria)]